MTEPYIPFYPADYLANTMHLTIEEHGAYLKLMFCMWRAGGTLPDNDKKVCTMLSIGMKKWQAIKPVIAPYFTYENGVFFQRRLAEELKKAEGKREERAISGSAGGKAKALKNKEAGLANATNLLQQNPSISDSYISSEDKSSSDIDARKPAPDQCVLPEWIDRPAWDAFMEVRKAARAKNTPYALRCIIADLERFSAKGHDPTELLRTAIKNGWKSVYEPKTYGTQHAKPSKHTGFSDTDYAGSAKDSGFVVV